jgi:hypothetical protein
MRQRTGKNYRSKIKIEKGMHVTVSKMSWKASTPGPIND